MTPATLTPGTRLGPFEILSSLGEGGMGAVYRARDTKLDRDVAIKVLLPAVANDPERLARFQREARVLASLNHPHIAAIYGLEDAKGVPALVLELVEGPTLADRIPKGPIPLDEALPIAKQIAEALEAAHEQGIIHRDLKPANIKVRSDGAVKVLDFGLAKAMAPVAGSSPSMSMSPTITTPAMTQAGVILGTAAYMSPEQAKGRAVDKRSDLWAFGAVLYEMLTGRRAFGGDDVTDTIVAVMSKEPDWNALPAQTPASIRKLLRRCLEKDVKRRLPDAAMIRLEIDDAASDRDAAPLPSPRSNSVWWPWAVAGLSVLVALGALLVRPRGVDPRASSAAQATWLTVAPPADKPYFLGGNARSAVITPDGARIVYVTRGGLAVRVLASPTTTVLPGAEGGRAPFVSPDGERVGFGGETGGVLWTPIQGGPVRPIVKADNALTPFFRGGAFVPDGGVIYATGRSKGLMRIPAEGAEPQRLTTTDEARSETEHRWPVVLPNGRGVLFEVAVGEGSAQSSQVAVLDFKSGNYRVLTTGSQPAYLESGHLLFVRGGQLFAAAFDGDRLALSSAPVMLVDGVAAMQNGAAEFSVSQSGTLVYLGGIVNMARSLVWMDRAGHETPIPAPHLNYFYPRVSPDGTRVALDTRDNGGAYIALYDLARNVLSRVTLGVTGGQYPVWHSDGRHLFFGMTVGNRGVMSQSVDGTGAGVQVTDDQSTNSSPYSFEPSASRLVVSMSNASAAGIGLVSTSSPLAHVEPLVTSTTGQLFNGEISPDGRFLAFQSNESGRFEVYVVPFPGVKAAHWQVSTSGGTRPVWSRNGQELFFLDTSGAMMRVPTPLGQNFSPGGVEKLFDGVAAMAGFPQGRNYDVGPDGRFLMVKDGFLDSARPLELTIVLNWAAELKARVPTK